MVKFFWNSKSIIEKAEELLPDADINQFHAKTFEIMKKLREGYYERRVEEFLSRLTISEEAKKVIKENLLKKVVVNGKEYSNFIEEVSRRVSQVFQVLSGTIAELVIERELVRVGLKLNKDFVKRKERADFIIYHKNLKHRIEVKNVKLRERGTRGLAFDGDSMVGFFNQPSEFTESNVKIIDNHCTKTGGYCYVPPETLKKIKPKTVRFRPNTLFAKDMKFFVQNGRLPSRPPKI